MTASHIKAMIFVCALSLSLGIAVAAWSAEDTLIVNKGANSSVISGTVTDVGNDTITINNNNNEIRVEIDALDLDRSARDLIMPGMQLTFQGEFKDFGATPTFEADSMVRTTNSTISAPEAVLLDGGTIRN